MPKWTLLLLLFFIPALLSCESGPTPTADRPPVTITVYTLPASPQVAADDPLNQRIDVDFEGANLLTVINYIFQTTDINIFVNWADLLLVGTEQDMPIDLHLKDVAVWKVLDLITQQATAIAGDLDPIGWEQRDGVITISTARELKRDTTITVYDIGQLISPPPCCFESKLRKQAAASSKEKPNLVPGVLGGLVSEHSPPQQLFDSGEPPIGEVEAKRRDSIQTVMGLIFDTVGTSDEWGSQESTLSAFNGSLIIKTTPRNHAEIRALLSVLPSPPCWGGCKTCGE